MTTQELPNSSSSTLKWNYDVFLSFRGEDTRKTFTDHLFEALKQRGIRTFRDNDRLERGKEISGELLKAIEESRISVIVLSSNYASSPWCLDELVKILECKQTKGQTVLPIFYNVDPSEVRRQMTGSFAQAFAKYEERFKEKMEMVRSWKAALREVANLSGWDLRDIADGHEAKFIKGIIQAIWIKLNHTLLLDVAEHPVGIVSDVEKINGLLDVGGSDDVHITGILGIGGIGKTTLAKAIYNQIAEQFEGSTFLANVREDSGKHGLIHLQRKLLCEILKEENLAISNADRGVVIIKERLCYKRVLVILDDVDDADQLKKLAGSPNWFGLGSKIIITTRDQHLLTRYEICTTYKVEELNVEEALQLFRLHAFTKDHPPASDFLELSNHVVKYAGGLPLALEVLGSLLREKSIDEWRSTLKRLKKNLNKKIHGTLKISFDGLDRPDKNIFLDVACFFKGENKDYVTAVLKSFDPEAGLGNLIRRSLVTISDNRLWMHDLVQEMGREIVHQESPDEPGKRSRLWFDKDVYCVLRRNTGTDAVQGIFLNFSTPDGVHFSNDAFSRMKNLRLLNICNESLVTHTEYFFEEGVLKHGNMNAFEGINYLPDALTCLKWHVYPSKSLPSNFHPWDLVEIDMRCSRLEQLWKNQINLENLEFLNLSHSQYLTETPDFSGFPRLKMLILQGCTKLVKVHRSNLVLDMLVFLNLKDCKSLKSIWKSIELESLQTLILSGCSKLEKFPEILRTMEHLSEVYLDGTGIKELPSSITHLKRLVMLNLGNCKNLASLPSGICELKSLETLTLSGCSKLEKLPENLGNLQNLVELHLDGTAITQPPSSVELLKNLHTLSFRGCKGSSSHWGKSIFSPFSLLGRVPCSSGLMLPCLSGLRSLRSLDLSDCNLSGGGIFSAIVGLSSLEDLDLSKNNFAILPATFNQFNSLRNLRLEHCTRLQELPPLPASIGEIHAHGCISLENLSCPPQNLELDRRRFMFGDCKILAGHKGSTFFQRHCQAISAKMGFNLLVPGSEIPEWINQQTMGSSICFKMSALEYSKLKGFNFCAVFTLKGATGSQHKLVINLFDVIDGVPSRLGIYPFIPIPGNRYIESDHVWLRYWPRDRFLGYLRSDGCHHMKASFESSSLQVKKCGIHIICEEDDEPTMKHSSSSFHISTLEEEEEEEEEEDGTIIKHKRRLVEEEPGGSGCSDERMRGNTNTALKLKDEESL